jgi:hypothetical protein
MALALGKLTTGTPKFRGSGFVGMHVKPITAQKKFNFPRANAILARAQALLWVRDCTFPSQSRQWQHAKHVPGIKYIGSKLVGFGTVGINHDITVLFLAY